MKRISKVSLLAMVLILGLSASAAAQEFVPGELIVKMKPGASAAAVSALAGPGALSTAAVSKSTGAMLVKLGDGVAVTSAVALLAGNADIEYAEPNWILYATAVPNDPQQGSQWEWAVIDAYDAWDIQTGDPTIVVNVIDSGINTSHPDLVDNLWTNLAEVGGSAGVDDDGNGYVDDIHGWNAIANNGSPEDDNSHGTHCAGTIGAVSDNSTGVAGTNWNSAIVACKFLNGAGSGSTFDAIECVDYIIDTKNAGSADIRVSSNSWGGGGSSAAMKAAIQSAVDAGILWVNAAGNDSADNDCGASGAFPSSYDINGLIAVASTTSSDGMSSFSNFGQASVQIGAPGSSILSTVLGTSYGSKSGTSMACPHVAGLAALVLAQNPALTVPELLEVLLCTGDPISSLDGKTATGMRINALSAVTAAGAVITCSDRDGDGVSDYADNCPYDSNDQSDSDGDGVGDACEPDDCGGCL